MGLNVAMPSAFCKTDVLLHGIDSVILCYTGWIYSLPFYLSAVSDLL